MRAPEGDLLKRVLGLGRRLDLLIITEEGDVVEPRFEWFMNSAVRSRAAEFVKDPEGYLNQPPSAPTEPDDVSS